MDIKVTDFMADITDALKEKKLEYGCKKCRQKLTKVYLGESLFGGCAFYCDNKECDKYGYLTVVGVKM